MNLCDTIVTQMKHLMETFDYLGHLRGENYNHYNHKSEVYTKRYHFVRAFIFEQMLLSHILSMI